MAAVSSFFVAHGGLLVILFMAFNIAGIVIKAVADIFMALGKQAPGFLGSLSSVIGQALHFLNQSAPAPVAASPAPASNAVDASKPL